MKDIALILFALLLIALPAVDAKRKVSKQLQEAMQKRQCFDPSHYNKKFQHLFILGETQLGNGDVLK